jgi:hypothetical protein
MTTKEKSTWAPEIRGIRGIRVNIKNLHSTTAPIDIGYRKAM